MTKRKTIQNLKCTLGRSEVQFLLLKLFPELLTLLPGLLQGVLLLPKGAWDLSRQWQRKFLNFPAPPQEISKFIEEFNSTVS